jgi:16S rRNA (adenine1518-N6/adenine1519-N6)-dimethyltransferase
MEHRTKNENSSGTEITASKNLSDIRTVKNILGGLGRRPNKLLGQNFLVSETILQRIVEAADIAPDDVILEVGPGLGVLTEKLSLSAGRVIAVEKDRDLAEHLTQAFSSKKNVKFIEGDILTIDTKRLGITPQAYKIVADIPYYLTSRFLRTFLESPLQPSVFVLLVQKEVAERIIAKPPHATILSSAIQYYADATVVRAVPRSSFYPIPGVDSAILKLVLKRKFDKNFDSKFFSLLKMCFKSPRKQIVHNLSSNYDRSDAVKWLTLANIGTSERPQNIGIENMIKLAKIIEKEDDLTSKK